MLKRNYNDTHIHTISDQQIYIGGRSNRTDSVRCFATDNVSSVCES